MLKAWDEMVSAYDKMVVGEGLQQGGSVQDVTSALIKVGMNSTTHVLISLGHLDCHMSSGI